MFQVCTSVSPPKPTVSITYKWDFYNYSYTWGPLEIDEVSYLDILYYYRFVKQHPLFYSWNAKYYVDTYTLDRYSIEYVKPVVDALIYAANRDGYLGSRAVDFVISFVQGMPYVPDNVSTSFDDYPRYPIETLLENGGDCEDTVLLSATLLRQMGYGTAIIFLPAYAPEYAALGVLGNKTVIGTYYLVDGKRYYYVETTGQGWQVGQVPFEYYGTLAIVVPLINIPGISILAEKNETVRIIGPDSEEEIIDDCEMITEFIEIEQSQQEERR